MTAGLNRGELSQLETICRKLAGLLGPDTAGPDTADPDVAGPDTAGPDTADPDMTVNDKKKEVLLP